MASVGTPVFFKNKEYRNASDALQAYILDFEGKQVKYYGKKSKYDKQFLELFCPNYSNCSASLSSQSPSKSGNSVRKLVEESYDKFYKEQNHLVQNSLTASAKLMEMLDKDRLPSPTRSTILMGRPSTGSVTDTDILINAKPFIRINVNNEKTPGNTYQLPINNSKINGHSMGSVNATDSSRLGQHSTMQAGDILTNHQAQFPGIQAVNYKFPHGMHNPDILSQSQLGQIKSKTSKVQTNYNPTGVSLAGVNNRDSSFGFKTPEKQKANFSNSRSTYQTAVSIDKSVLGFPNETAGTTADSDATESSTSSIITGHMLKGALPHKIGLSKVSSTPIKGGLAKTANVNHNSETRPPITTQQLPFEGDKTKSSIGQGLEFNDLTVIPPDFEQQCAAILKHGVSFDRSLVEKAPTDKPDLSYGRRDIVGILKGNPPSKNGTSPARGKKTMSRVSFTTDDLLDGDPTGLLAIENLRPRSKSLPRPQSYDFNNVKKNTESPNNSSSRQSRRDINDLLNSLSFSSPQTHSKNRQVTISPDSKSNNVYITSDRASFHSPREENHLNRSYQRAFSSPKSSENHLGSSPKESKYRTSDRASFHSPREDHLNRSYQRSFSSPKSHENQLGSSPKESKYRKFLQSLMKEIDDGDSSITTSIAYGGQQNNGGVENNSFDGNYLTRPLHGGMTDPSSGQDCGFLERIQNLLSSEAVPTISQYLEADDVHDSLTTEAILDGDRPWEKRPVFKSPKEVLELDTTRKPNTIFDKFMDDCMAEAKGKVDTVTGTTQPGSLEALKNMLFTVQGLSTSQDEDSFGQHTPRDEPRLLGAADGPENEPNLPLDDSISQLLSPETKKLLSHSYSEQPCLVKAMEHLSKLKDLVEKKE